MRAHLRGQKTLLYCISAGWLLLAASDSLTGSGKGSIEVNVVWGSVDLKSWD